MFRILSRARWFNVIVFVLGVMGGAIARDGEFSAVSLVGLAILSLIAAFFVDEPKEAETPKIK